MSNTFQRLDETELRNRLAAIDAELGYNHGEERHMLQAEYDALCDILAERGTPDPVDLDDTQPEAGIDVPNTLDRQPLTTQSGSANGRSATGQDARAKATTVPTRGRT